MVFQTPHDFWLNKSGNKTTFGYYPWMGIGDWECSSIFGFDGPAPSCLKHDVAYASLQKFTGANPQNIRGGWENGDELDEAWNPRNKSLADSKFYADVKKHKCELSAIGWRILTCWWPRDLMAGYFFGGVGNLGDRNWPVTEVDTEHIGGYRNTLDADSSEYRFFPCYGLVPSTANVSVTHTLRRGFTMNWDNDLEGCIPGITIKEIETCITPVYHGTWEHRCTKATGTPTSAFISLGIYWNATPASLVIVETRLYPDKWEYGEKYYSNVHYIHDIKRN